SVLDKSRQPVAGLTARDFTVLVDGKPRTIAAFKSIELARELPPSTPWLRDIAPDVTSNVYPSGRVIAILIDDYSFFNADIGPGGLLKAREIARRAMEQIGTADRAAVLFTANAHTAQSFTSDRRLLTDAIEKSALVSGSQKEFTTGATGGKVLTDEE